MATRRDSQPLGVGCADGPTDAQAAELLRSAAFQPWEPTYLRRVCQAGSVQQCQGKKNHCGPAFLTRRSLPNSLARLCWPSSLSVFSLKPVQNISARAGPGEPLEHNFIIRKA